MFNTSLKKLTILAIVLCMAAAVGACNWDGPNAGRSGLDMAETPGLKEISKAAELGNADAQYNLGMAYLIGRGVPQDGRHAKVLFLKAAEQGYSPVHAKTGWSYARSRGFTKKEKKSTAPIPKADEQVSKLAQN
jgi:hypothetical protein